MAEERPHYHINDVGPFASLVHSLIQGSSPQELNIDMRDRDVMLNVEIDEHRNRLLHLQNVREDTVDQAQVAVNDFLDQLKTADDGNGTHPKRQAHTMLENFDSVHLSLRDYIEAQAEKRGLLFKWARGGFPRDSFRQARSQPKYIVRYSKDDKRECVTGTRTVAPWADRVASGIISSNK